MRVLDNVVPGVIEPVDGSAWELSDPFGKKLLREAEISHAPKDDHWPIFKQRQSGFNILNHSVAGDTGAQRNVTHEALDGDAIGNAVVR